MWSLCGAGCLPRRRLFAPAPTVSHGKEFLQTERPGYSACWFSAWVLCVLHVICAFQFRHHWVHALAIQHTAQMTERVIGIRWGGGLYINYIFLVCWGIFAVHAVRSGGYQTVNGRRLETTVHAFAAFMIFNATAVFGPAWWWIPTILVVFAIVYRTLAARQLNNEN